MTKKTGKRQPDPTMMRVGKRVRDMRDERGWTQLDLLKRVLRAEGRPDADVTDQVNAMRVHRIEKGYPTTMRNLRGFALAFGYRTVVDWLVALFVAGDLSESEQALLSRFRQLDAVGQQAVLTIARTLPAPNHPGAQGRARRRPVQ